MASLVTSMHHLKEKPIMRDFNKGSLTNLCVYIAHKSTS